MRAKQIIHFEVREIVERQTLIEAQDLPFSLST